MAKKRDDDAGGKLVVLPGGKQKRKPRRMDEVALEEAEGHGLVPWELRHDLDAKVGALIAVAEADDPDPLERIARELDAARATLVTAAKVGGGVDAKHVLTLEKLEGLANRRKLFEEARSLTIEGGDAA